MCNCSRQLKEHFINGLNDYIIIIEIIKELTAMNHMNWVRRIEAQREKNNILETLKENRNFDTGYSQPYRAKLLQKEKFAKRDK